MDYCLIQGDVFGGMIQIGIGVNTGLVPNRRQAIYK